MRSAGRVFIVSQIFVLSAFSTLTPLQTWAEDSRSTAIPISPVPASTPTPEPPQPLAPEALLPLFREKLQANYFPPYLEKAFKKSTDSDLEGVISEIDGYQSEETFSKRRPLPERALLLKALALIDQKKLLEAETTLKQATSLKGSNVECTFLLGVIHAAQADFKSALQNFSEVAWFGKGTVATPDIAQLAIGLSYRREKDTVKALAAYNAALSLNPGSVRARLEIAAVSLETNDKAQALTQLRSVITENPTSFEARLSLARALLVNADRLLNRKDIAEAKQIMSEILKPKDLDKDQFLEALPVYVQANLASGELDAANKMVEAALKHDPSSTIILQLRDQIDLERQSHG